MADVNGQVEKVRVCGTYTALDAAKNAAHRVLFEAGYEKEWFTEYDTKQDDFIAHGIKQRLGLVVLDKASDGTIFPSQHSNHAKRTSIRGRWRS